VLGGERVAVVGCSTTPGKDAHEVPVYLQEQGYEVVPVNPHAETVLGRPAHDSLREVPGRVDVVDVFRPSDEVAGIVDDAVAHGDVGVIWLQLGIEDEAATARAESHGIDVVTGRCMRSEHQRLLG
jgi:predicted CoA-binding protein